MTAEASPATAGGIARRWLIRALDAVLPPRCLNCGKTIAGTARLCGGCWQGLSFLAPPWCRRCGYPLPESAAAAPLCAVCAASPPVFDRARAALRYDDGARGMILRFKHADRTDIARTFGQLLLRAGTELVAGDPVIAPVPLHRWRLLRRGYNQAGLLAHALARELRLPARRGEARLIPDLLQRVRATASQQGLGAEQRQLNVTAAAFRLHPRHRDAIAGRRVLLIDDVLTTGATLGACSRVLRAGGAAAVDILVLARVVQDQSAPISWDEPTVVDGPEALGPPSAGATASKARLQAAPANPE
jgi:ComF family protein